MFYSLIFGSDLITFLKTYSRNNPSYKKLASQVDPNGSNIVEFSMLHNDEDIRAIMLIKTNGSDVPFRASIDFPIKAYNAMVQKVLYEKDATSN